MAYERIRSEVAQLCTIYNDWIDRDIDAVGLLDLAAALRDGIVVESRILDCMHDPARLGDELPTLVSDEWVWLRHWNATVARIVALGNEPTLTVC